jgi:hypothetical protein
MLLLGTSEIFLLHLRQCRYYSITVLAEILVAYGIYQILAKNKTGPWLVFSGLTLQFYCNYTIAAANIPVLLVLAVVLFWQKKSSALPVIICLGACLLVFVPWLLYTRVWHQLSAESPVPWTKMVWFYASQFHFNFFPWCIVLLPAWDWLSRHFRKGAIAPVTEKPVAHLEKYLVLLPVLYLPVLLIMPGAHLRYLLPVLPVLCLLVAAWLFRYIKWTVVAIAILLLQCFTNVFAVATNPFGGYHPLHFPVTTFISGVGQPYENRFTDVLKFLNARAHPRDLILSWDPELPLVFYVPYRVVDALLPMRARYPSPDWILPQSISGVLNEQPGPLPDMLRLQYEQITLTVHDSLRYDDVPEPSLYQYQTTKTAAPFVIYRLKKETGPPPEKKPPIEP